MRTIDADRLLEEKRIHTYYHLPNGDIAIPLIDIKNAPTIEPQRTGRRMDLIDRQRLLVEARKLNSAITGRDKPFPVAEAFMEVINRQPIIEMEGES